VGVPLRGISPVKTTNFFFDFLFAVLSEDIVFNSNNFKGLANFPSLLRELF